MTGRPTRVQVQVLKAVQNHAAQIHRMVGRAERAYAHTATSPPPEWYRDLEHKVRVQEALEAAVLSAGTPPEWVEQVRERGKLGMSWRAQLHWRATTPTDRQVVAARLRAEIERVQDLAALAAAYGERGAHTEPGTASLFDRELRRSGDRVGVLTAVFDPSDTEAEQLWGEHTWTAAADSVRGADDGELAARWRAHVRADTTISTQQATALADAGLTAHLATRRAPSPAQMVHRLRGLLHAEPDPAPADTGHQIAAAIDAAALTTGPESDSTTTTSGAPPVAAPDRGIGP
ncbi:hypothetical protein [Nocardia blacklockiae]|uniref:hypothetical protein n=1 Tax=Nocardia blacklockiae TaxID=480036 RepID=UPI001894C5AB|nr:hypothetical protein [Nocardia blacklockiae]MBF6176046.1 hypothetical protein [Nocardia blacklockiae]